MPLATSKNFLFLRYLKSYICNSIAGIKDIFSIIIDIVDKNLARQKTVQVVHPTSSPSVADELMKLAKLKDAGVLSEEEFNIQKSKLLNK